MTRAEYMRDWRRAKSAADPKWASARCEYNKVRRRKNLRDPEKWLKICLYTVKGRARAAGVAFSITAEDLAVTTHCPVFGVPFTFSGDVCRPDGPSVDRLRPDLGYVPGNVRIISYLANRLKNNGTLAQHRQLVAWMERELEPDAHQHTEGIV